MNITKDEYLRLRLAEAKLSMLEGGGVDNWQWYAPTLWPDGEKTIDQIEEEIKAEIGDLK